MWGKADVEAEDTGGTQEHGFDEQPLCLILKH